MGKSGKKREENWEKKKGNSREFSSNLCQDLCVTFFEFKVEYLSKPVKPTTYKVFIYTNCEIYTNTPKVYLGSVNPLSLNDVFAGAVLPRS